MPPFFQVKVMELILYKTESADNVINKTLSNPLALDINLRRGVDISAPVLRLQLSVDLSGYNYAHIPDLNRYYFISDIESLTLDVWQLRLSVDVLESYKVDILASNARYMRGIRTGDYFNATLDSNINASVSLHESNKGFEGEPTLILTTVGEGA